MVADLFTYVKYRPRPLAPHKTKQGTLLAIVPRGKREKGEEEMCHTLNLNFHSAHRHPCKKKPYKMKYKEVAYLYTLDRVTYNPCNAPKTTSKQQQLQLLY